MTDLKVSGPTPGSDAHPQFALSLTPGLQYNRAGHMIIIAFRQRDAENWTTNGVAFTDTDGATSFTITSFLNDGDWEVRAQAKDPADPNQTLVSPVLAFNISRPAAPPLMPPSWESWDEESEAGRYGVLGCMTITTTPQRGAEVGRILPLVPSKPPSVFSLSGDGSAGLTINVTSGMIEVMDHEEFLVPGLRHLTVTATNSEGEASTTVPFRVVHTQPRQWFVDDGAAGSDENDGTTPERAFKTIERAISARRSEWEGPSTIFLKRGASFPCSGGLRIHSSTTWTSYGDPAEPSPHVLFEGKVGVYQDQRAKDFRIEDIDFSGAVRCFEGRGAADVTLLRVMFSSNHDNGKDGNALYAHGYSNFRLLHSTVADGINGDGVYLRKLGLSDRSSVNKILYCVFGIPRGGASDNLQITSERKDGMGCYDVQIAHCAFHHERSSDSTKGNLVLEGCTGFLIEGNNFSGRYFCASILSKQGTVRNNTLSFADLDQNSFALGSAGLGNTGQQRWLYNRIVASNWGMALSGYKDPESGWQRYDYDVLLNTLAGNRAVMKIDRPMSGSVRFNLAQFNGDATITRRGAGRKIANGGASREYMGQSNWFNVDAGPTVTNVAQLTGTFAVNGKVVVDFPQIEEATVEVIWLLNNRPVEGVGGAEWTVPPAENDPWMPVFASGATIGAAVIYADHAGNRTIVPACLSDGSTAALIAPAGRR